MRLAKQIVLATLNREKFEEFRELFTSYPGVELVLAESVIRNPQKLALVEKYDNYRENALAKARLANLGSHYPCLSDDSGLEVLALDGKPGVRSHRFAPPQKGISQDQANVDLLLKEMAGKADRTARFHCTLILLIEGVSVQGTGILEGSVATAPRGKNGFGYDPIFIPKGSDRTFAEMTSVEKNAISHRTKAVEDLMMQVKAHGIVFAKP